MSSLQTGTAEAALVVPDWTGFLYQPRQARTDWLWAALLYFKLAPNLPSGFAPGSLLATVWSRFWGEGGGKKYLLFKLFFFPDVLFM